MTKTAVGWHVELEFDEDEQHTRAAAFVRLPDGNEVRAHGCRTAAEVYADLLNSGDALTA
jgi:hypothetical protein